MIITPIPSEIFNLVNFLVLDVVFLSLIMIVSGRLAGHANHALLMLHDKVKLANFDAPLIGGGLVMQRGWLRNALILLRVSVVCAVALCNFGLEGRSQTTYEEREVSLRCPRHVPEEESQREISLRHRPTVPMNESEDGYRMKVFQWVELRMRCGKLEDDQLFEFRSVLNDHCYSDIKGYVYIKKMAITHTREWNISMTNCIATPTCKLGTTVYRCTEADIVCRGIDNNSSCTGEVNEVIPGTCKALVYDEHGHSARFCDHAAPNGSGEHSKCMYLEAEREDVQSWTGFYPHITDEPVRAIFAAAYAVEMNEMVLIPGGDNGVTVVRLYWLVPAAWVVFVTMFLTIAWVIVARSASGIAAHDESGLSVLLGNELKRKDDDFDAL